ncbi:endonuclease V [Gilliamella sp. Pas-s95]|uniref:endonuclease V n=1 Tax=Gilliamella sp. Pas-s95 TaxID=2687317 RepID=UPI00132609D9|nr:endonuclease V [Gilliamella sp. Pas-s95]MWN05252.1 endonuclease V [Gilliamella sp. Pas-s95]
MILAIDVYYIDNCAKAVGVLFHHWTDSTSAIEQVITDYQDNVAPYQSGQFYQRELPCIMSLLDKINLSKLTCIVIDGYVHLDEGKIGLGGHLYHALNKTIPIIGVAKKPFSGNSEYLIEVLRGQSKHPLYVTSIGIPLINAANSVQSMAGKHRMPDVLSYLDQQTKLFKHEE